MKLQISMNDDLLKRADKFAEDSYLSRSGLISLALTQFLQANELTGAIRDISLAMRKIADTGEIDDETKTQLEDFERLVKLLSSK